MNTPATPHLTESFADTPSTSRRLQFNLFLLEAGNTRDFGLEAGNTRDVGIQVCGDTSGLTVDDPLIKTGVPLSPERGPGIPDGIYDGIQHPLENIQTLLQMFEFMRLGNDRLVKEIIRLGGDTVSECSDFQRCIHEINDDIQRSIVQNLWYLKTRLHTWVQIFRYPRRSYSRSSRFSVPLKRSLARMQIFRYIKDASANADGRFPWTVLVQVRFSSAQKETLQGEEWAQSYENCPRDEFRDEMREENNCLQWDQCKYNKRKTGPTFLTGYCRSVHECNNRCSFAVGVNEAHTAADDQTAVAGVEVTAEADHTIVMDTIQSCARPRGNMQSSAVSQENGKSPDTFAHANADFQPRLHTERMMVAFCATEQKMNHPTPQPTQGQISMEPKLAAQDAGGSNAIYSERDSPGYAFIGQTYEGSGALSDNNNLTTTKRVHFSERLGRQTSNLQVETTSSSGKAQQTPFFNLV